MGEKGMRTFENISIRFLFVISLWLLGMGETLSQPATQEEKGPQIKLGEVTFQVREFISAPSPFTLLEVRIEIRNQSRKSAAPPHSIKVVLTPREVNYFGPKPAEDLSLHPEEVILDVPLPPQAVRLLTVGLSLPKEKPGSITFEVQINPPEGEKKMVTWKEDGG
jgi:hypothetical protein